MNDDLIRAISRAPAVDAVEVVRCMDCRMAAMLRKPKGEVIADCMLRKFHTDDWDAKKGMELYKQGLSDAEIARQLGVSTKSFSSYRAYHHWGERNHSTNKVGRPSGGAGWDKKKGYELYCRGMKDSQIAMALGTTQVSVSNYRRRHWRSELGTDRAD